MKAKWILLAIVLALPVASFSAYAAGGNQLSRHDKVWMKKAHQVNMAEIKAGQLAEKQGKAAVIKQVGHTLISDHRMLDRQLTQAAHALGVSLPDMPSAKQIATMQMLQTKSGAKFDKTWARAMLHAHMKAINKTEMEISRASSPKVKQLAQKTLPVLQTHLNMLQKAETKLK